MHAGLYKDSRFVYGGFDRNIPARNAVRRHLLSDAERYRGETDRHQSGGRRRSGLRWRRLPEPVQPDGGELQLLRRHHHSQHQCCVHGRIEEYRGRERIHAEAFRLENIGRGVQDEWSGSRDFYIADNVFIGRHDPHQVAELESGECVVEIPRFPSSIASEYAVKVYGQGHVVAYNYVANWHDGIDIATYGDPEGTPKKSRTARRSGIDFYNNDFYNMADNCIEADGGAHNIRVFRNRCFNSAGGALSAQPSFGGPTYFYQNLVYAATSGGPLNSWIRPPAY